MKTYVVNGAAHQGFGETTARSIINKGDKVIGLYLPEDSQNADKLRNEFTKDKLELIGIDYEGYSSLAKAIDRIPFGIDGFVNADFFFEMEDVENFDYHLYERIFYANYSLPMYLAIELKKKMNLFSSIVFVTSTESDRGSFGGISYAASKAAVHNLIKSLACNWGKNEKIRVNAVAAGWIGGEMDTDGPFEVSIGITPLGRLGHPDDVSNTINFLLSDQAQFINAQVIYVDGGYLAVDDIAKYEFEESRKNEE